MLQIVLVVAVGWIALSLLVLPLLMLLGRAGYRADTDAVRHHDEMRTTAPPVLTSVPTEPVHAAHV